MAKFIFMKILGMMSGTSLDGLDFCLVDFFSKNKFRILATATYSYKPFLIKDLQEVFHSSAGALAELHFDYSREVAGMTLKFLKNKPKPDLLVFSGHTIFHEPSEKGFTFQLGSVPVLSALTGKTVIGDLRSADVALNGQGAPLVPCAEFDLFPGYDYFLNLGGICNFSYKKGKKIFGKDIAPCNMALNYLAGKMGLLYDKDGKISSASPFKPELVSMFSQHFIHNEKSLGKEDFIRYWVPLINESEKNTPVPVILSSVTRAIAECIVKNMNPEKRKKILITGGGAWNKTLISHIKNLSPQTEWIIPDKQIVKYKEALVFAYLGYKSWKNEKNILSSVTGCKKNHTAGCIARVL